jgi:DNA invertase Pin-like site-specific DNA recombinase
MNAFSYLRVSGRGQIDGDGFTRQREAIAKRCKAMGATITQEFVEAGVCGANDLENRPALKALFAALLADGVRVVIVERSDRFSRDLMVGEVLLARFREMGATVIEAEDGRELTANDPDNPTATLVRQILAAVAQFDKAGIVSKLRKARARKREETGRCEGRKPFGYRPGELAIVDRMRQLRRKPVGGDRLSFAEIAAALDAEGLLSRSGKPWCASSIREILGA